MLRFAKIENEETKEVSVGIGTNADFYKSIGMTEMDVEQAYNGVWYVKGYVPEAPAPTREEIKQLRKAYRHEHIDDNTLERNRKIANGSWTEEDEAAYLALDAEVTAHIEKNLPYPTEPIVEDSAK